MLRLPREINSVTVSLHPAFALRGIQQLLPHIREVIASAPEALGQRPRIVPNVLPSAGDVRRMLQDTNIASIDVETGQEKGDIRLVGVCVEAEYPLSVRWTPEVARIVGDWLGDPNNIVIGQNFGFDTEAFAVNGIVVRAQVINLMDAAALVHPANGRMKKMRWFNLGLEGTRYVKGIWNWKPRRRKDGTVEWEDVLPLYRTWFPEVPEWCKEELYNCLDAAIPVLIWKTLMEALIRTGQWGLFKNIVMPCGSALTRMTMKGATFDVHQRDELRKKVSQEVTAARERVLDAARDMHAKRRQRVAEAIRPLEEQREAIWATKGGRRDPAAKELSERIRKGNTLLKQIGEEFKADNDNHWRWLLYDKETGLGLHEIRRGKSKVPKVDRKAITRLAQIYGATLPGIVKDRLVIGIGRSRLKRVLALEPEADGRIHFAFSLHRANGRVTSGGEEDEDAKARGEEAQNGQNWQDEDRRIITASGPVRLLFGPDSSQIEARIAAWLARDIAALTAYRDGIDVYCLTAAAMYGIPLEDANSTRERKVTIAGREDTMRQVAKKAKLGKGYLMQPKRCSEETGLPIDVVKRAYAADDEMFPGIVRWQREMREELYRNWKGWNDFGRLFRAPSWGYNKEEGRVLPSEEAVRKWVAFKPQTDAADMIKVHIVECEKIALECGADLLLNVHDQLVFDVPEERLDALMPRVLRQMEREWPELGEIPGWGRFRCPAEALVGWNWGKWDERENPKGLKKVEVGR